MHLANFANKEGGGGRPVDIHYASAKIGREVWKSDNGARGGTSVGIDLFTGGFVALPIDHESSSLVGWVVTPRIRYPVKPGVDAFIAPDIGLVWGDWKKQGGDFNFLVGGQTGFLIEINAVMDLSLSTGLFHISNAGMKKENPGYNADLFMVGFEYEF